MGFCRGSWRPVGSHCRSRLNPSTIGRGKGMSSSASHYRSSPPSKVVEIPLESSSNNDENVKTRSFSKPAKHLRFFNHFMTTTTPTRPWRALTAPSLPQNRWDSPRFIPEQQWKEKSKIQLKPIFAISDFGANGAIGWQKTLKVLRRTLHEPRPTKNIHWQCKISKEKRNKEETRNCWAPIHHRPARSRGLEQRQRRHTEIHLPMASIRPESL